MSSRAKELDELTTKEKVVSIARKDPFLKVKEIANLANTTSHYVRTVLSEANLSLAKLRKEYAEPNVEKAKKQSSLKELLDFSAVDLIISRELDCTLLTKSTHYQLLNQESELLLEATKVFSISDSPELLNTYFVSGVDEKTTLSQLMNNFNLKFSPLRVRVMEADQQVADLLECEINTSLLVLERKIFIDWKLRGLEVMYCNSSNINLVVDKGIIKIVSFTDE